LKAKKEIAGAKLEVVDLNLTAGRKFHARTKRVSAPSILAKNRISKPDAHFSARVGMIFLERAPAAFVKLARDVLFIEPCPGCWPMKPAL
jgi:hypothetical protein